ncbi:MAG: nicotinate (nicotinamide) nucleotide adenylyltransferase [Myxococcota bacterium]
MRIAVYGGSFNPPHVGHAMVAGWVRWADRADEVWLLPVYRHAFGKPLAPWSTRLAMCEALARAVGPWVRVEPVEATLAGVSYTVRTLDVLSGRHPEHSFHLVVGADVLPQAPHWKDWPAIQARYAPIVVGRAGHGEVPDAPTFPEIASSDVRRRIAAGEPWAHLLPAGVVRIVKGEGLYLG